MSADWLKHCAGDEFRPGDLVEIRGSRLQEETLNKKSVVGTVVKRWSIPEWWDVMLPNGTIINWPASQLKVISRV